MKENLFKILTLAKMEIVAPVSGGGVGIFAWAVKLAPLISIIAALIGITLGIMSYRLKRKQALMEMEYYSTKVNQFKNK